MKKKILLSVFAGIVLVGQGNLLGEVYLLIERKSKKEDLVDTIKKLKKKPEKARNKRLGKLYFKSLNRGLPREEGTSIEELKMYEEALVGKDGNPNKLKGKAEHGMQSGLTPLQVIFWEAVPQPFDLYLLLNHYLNTADNKDINIVYKNMPLNWEKYEGKTILHEFPVFLKKHWHQPSWFTRGIPTQLTTHIFALLVNRGLSLTQKDKQGKTPLDYLEEELAINSIRKELVDMISKMQIKLKGLLAKLQSPKKARELQDTIQFYKNALGVLDKAVESQGLSSPDKLQDGVYENLKEVKLKPETKGAGSSDKKKQDIIGKLMEKDIENYSSK